MTVPRDFRWQPSNAPRQRRYDDIWILDPETVWAVNSDGAILKTEDGGASWQRKFHVASNGGSGIWLRAIGFADPQRGWVGTTSPQKPFYETRDGGENWSLVPDLPDGAPPFICGISVVNQSVIYASGTNDPANPTGVIKTTDGGESWQGQDMSQHADLLVDCYFPAPDCGWVVGGKADVPNAGRSEVKPVVLFTEDGGQSWRNQVEDIQDQFPKGEWGWKIFFVDQSVGYVSLENFDEGAVLKTTDGGASWVRKPVNDPQGNANLEGIGFVDEDAGWVGGWGDPQFSGGFSSGTDNGGNQWFDANQVGRFLNRFRFFGKPIQVGYSSGDTVYKYSSQPAPAPLLAELAAPALLAADQPEECEEKVEVTYQVPAGARRVTVEVWDRFAIYVGRILDQQDPPPGSQSIEWGFTDKAGKRLPAGYYVYRITVDDQSESRIVRLK